MTGKHVLIIYFSYSGQTRKLLQMFAKGFEDKAIEVSWLQLKPLTKIQFPLSSVNAALRMMVETFFRKRVAIEPLSPVDFGKYDLVIVAGPTWSYNASGPMLSFFDTYGEIVDGKKVLPFISCRGYWRTHYWQLRGLLDKSQAKALKPIVFLHTAAEPWRTIGVFLKLAGKMPESSGHWLSRFYQKYGHPKEQVLFARELGKETALALLENKLEHRLKAIVVKKAAL